MITLATGLIVGLKLDDRLQQVVKQAKENNVNLEHLDFVHKLGKINGKDYKFYLNQNDYAMEPNRKIAYLETRKKINEILEKDENANIIVRVPATIEFDHINMKFKDHKIIKENIKPDIIVTFIDAEWLIKTRLRNDYTNDPYLYSLAEDFKNFTIEQILDWMNEEVSLSEDWAEYMGIPHVVLGVGQPIESIIKITTIKDIPKFYASYPMTFATPQERKQIDKVIDRLKNHGLVVDPGAIEIDQDSDMTLDERRATFEYTVHRDLHWDVKKVDAIVAISPSERPAFSWGLTDEIQHARGYGIDIFVFMQKEGGPFGESQAYPTDSWFNDEEKLFEAISKKYPPLNT